MNQKLSWNALVRVLFACSALGFTPVAGQHFEARLGVMVSSVLVRDEAATAGLARALGADVVGPTDLKLAPAPAASALMVGTLGTRTQVEVGATFALSKLRASNEETDWEVQGVSVATATVGVRYQRWKSVALTAGAGATHFFSDDTGIFSEGNGLMPLIEVGALANFPVGTFPLHGVVRLQSHNFGTPALRREGAGEGKPVRLLVQVGFGRK